MLAVRTWTPLRRLEQTHSDPTPGSYLPDDRVIDRLPLADPLRSLSPRRRAVVILWFYLDNSVDETAEILGITPGHGREPIGARHGTAPHRSPTLEGN